MAKVVPIKWLARHLSSGMVLGTGFILANCPVEMGAAVVAAGFLADYTTYTTGAQLLQCLGFLVGGVGTLALAKIHPEIGRGKFGGDPHAAFRAALAERRARLARASPPKA